MKYFYFVLALFCLIGAIVLFLFSEEQEMVRFLILLGWIFSLKSEIEELKKVDNG